MRFNFKPGAINYWPLLLAAMMATAAGCQKKDATTGTPSPIAQDAASAGQPAAADATTQTPTPVQPPTTIVSARAENAVKDAVIGEPDSFLTRQLQIFIQQKGRMPGSFAEFANARLDSVPRPPVGKKWAIDAANNQVKAVDAN